jgi:hypothetical protein
MVKSNASNVYRQIKCIVSSNQMHRIVKSNASYRQNKCIVSSNQMHRIVKSNASNVTILWLWLRLRVSFLPPGSSPSPRKVLLEKSRMSGEGLLGGGLTVFEESFVGG